MAIAFDASGVRFDENGLVPCIVQDAETGRVLTLAYMNRESLLITCEEEKTCFWSRSRKTLWRKGETSGNFQHVLSLEADCDGDAILARVRKEGPACHRGTDSCFDTVPPRRRMRFRLTRGTRCCWTGRQRCRRGLIRPICLKRDSTRF